jgi:hypothetical protein
VSPSSKGVRGLKGRTVELSWWEWSLFRLVVFLITAPVVVAAVYLIFRQFGGRRAPKEALLVYPRARPRKF